MMRAQQEAARAEAPKKAAAAKAPARAAAAAKPAKRKRKFPYRKVEDLETDIAAAEDEVRQLEEAMASPDLYRDGDRVKQTTKAFEEAKARVAQLYEHWEEAVELN
jgi:ATP-binding cassette subfamily F protein 3